MQVVNFYVPIYPILMNVISQEHLERLSLHLEQMSTWTKHELIMVAVVIVVSVSNSLSSIRRLASIL